MGKKPTIFALVVAAGAGIRAGGGVPKQYQHIAGKPLIRYSLEAFLTHSRIAGVLVVVAPEHRAQYEAATAGLVLLPPVSGGTERQDSVKAGLAALAVRQPDYVLIHDAARPFVSATVIDRVIEALAADIAVVPTLPMADTVRRYIAKKDTWEEIPREGLLRIQTPQAFPFQKLLDLHASNTAPVTDDAALWLAANKKLQHIAGEYRLRKVTTVEDLMWAENAARAQHRIATGLGYDVHRFAQGTGVTLGGITIAHDQKLEGHSDADVALHALVDAILGALAEGDIGAHFPPSDPRWKGADSALFVAEAVRLMRARGGALLHADVTIICETPKIGPHREAIKQRIATLLDVPVTRVGIKATTTEGLGFTGRKEGIAAQALVTLSLPV